MTSMRILGLPGSLRARSHNRLLLERLRAEGPPEVQLSIFDSITHVPLFNEDEEHAPPAAVRELWAEARRADGLIIATPEYNQGIAAATKNLIDWLSRCPEGSPLSGKPVGVTGAATGWGGTRLAQHQLRGALVACGAYALPAMLFAPSVGSGYPESKQLRSFMRSLREWVDLVRERSPVLEMA